MSENWFSHSFSFIKKMLPNGSEGITVLDTSPVEGEPGEIEKRQKVFVILGTHTELHDRIQEKAGDFEETIQAIQYAITQGELFQIEIGISRYNFYCLHEIINFCFSLFDESIVVNYTFDIFPVHTIAHRFKTYVNNLRGDLRFQEKIYIEYIDNELNDILSKVGEQIKREPFKERDYIRFLSMMCEKTFIGPATIVMDPFHRCNTNCHHCWVHTPNVTQPQEFLNRKLDFDLFCSIVDDASELKSDLIILQGDGEPLMYEHTMDMLRYIRKKGIEAMFFTNGSLFDEERARAVIDIDIKEIYCSLPAGTRETYGRVCSLHENDTFFDRIVENMTRFIRLRKKMGKERPRLVVSHVMHNRNYMDLIPMAKLDAAMGADAVRFYLIRLDVMNMDLKLSDDQIKSMYDDIGEVDAILRKNGIHFIDNIRFQFEHYDGDTGAWCEDVFLKEGCSIGYYFCLIPALTDLSLCCHLRTVGWLNKIRFKDLWLSPEYERYRRQAKYLRNNRDVVFMNGVTLYDEHCTHCDNHQTLIYNIEEMKKLGWYTYLNL